MGSCKFRVRKKDYEGVLSTIHKLFSPDYYIILGDIKYKQWVESRYHCVFCDQSSDILTSITSINYIGCYKSLFDQYIDRVTEMDDLLYVVFEKDLDNILISREELMNELEINPSVYASLDDFFRDIKNKTGITYQVGYTGIPKEIIIPEILEMSLREVAEDRKNEFLLSLPWGGYKRNPRDRHEL